MKLSGAFTLVFATAALILSFLLIFAGNHPGVMTSPTYSIISLDQVNTSQIGENIVRQVVNQYLNDPDRLLQILNGLFANVIGSTLRGNTTGIQSILGGSGVTLPSGILPSGVSIPTTLPTVIPSNLPSFTISIPTSLPTNIQIPGIGSSKLRRDAEAEQLEERAAEPVAAVPQAELIAHSPLEEDLILRAVGGSLAKRDLITDILGAIPGGSSTFRNFSLADLPVAQQLANRIIQRFANQIGIYDFYDFHILKYCLGDYDPTAKANATVPLSAIRRNVTQCNSYDGLDLEQSVSNLLNQSGLAQQANISLSSINFPDDLDNYIKLAKSLLKALTALYSVVIGMAFFIMLLSLITFFQSGREIALGTCIWLLALLGLICAAVASIIITVAGRLIGSNINDLGNQLGLSYQIGKGFLGMTWAAFGCMFIITILTCFVCCSGRRRSRHDKKARRQKHLSGEKDPAYV